MSRKLWIANCDFEPFTLSKRQATIKYLISGRSLKAPVSDETAGTAKCESIIPTSNPARLARPISGVMFAMPFKIILHATRGDIRRIGWKGVVLR